MSLLPPIKRQHRCRNTLRGGLGESLELRLAMAAGPLVVTEIMYNPAGPTAEEKATGLSEADFEFIELQNVGDQSLALSEFTLSKGVAYTFKSVQLGAGQRVLVVNNRLALESRYGAGLPIAGEFSGSLANAGDALRIKDSAGQTVLDFTFVDSWYPTTDGGGYSLSIINPFAPLDTWSNASSWKASTAPGGTPGAENGPIDTTPPSVPQALQASLAAASQVALSWQTAIDAQSGIKQYQVYRNGTLIGSSFGTTYVDQTALANSTYNYQISAVNGFNIESARGSTATVVLPPVGVTPTFADGQEVGRVGDSGLIEASGIVASRRNPGMLYAHNDGPETGLVMLDSQARYLGRLTLSGVNSVDWEDIAIGPGPIAGENYIYIGDTGDNLENRSTSKIFRVREPQINPAGGDQSTTIPAGQVTAITLIYPDGPHNSETLLCDPLTGDLYVITKMLEPSRIYRASAAALAQGGTVQLSLVGTFNFVTPSAGDISPTGREILIRNEDTAFLYRRADGQTVAQALAGSPIVAKVIGTPTEANGEAIGFDSSGNGYFTISEGSNPRLYYFHRTSQSPGQGGGWHNAQLPSDVNRDGLVSALDVLVVVNDLNANGTRTLPNLGTATAPAQLDVNNDGLCSALDVLQIVNQLNSRAATTAASLEMTGGLAEVAAQSASAQPAVAQPLQSAAKAAAVDVAIGCESLADRHADISPFAFGQMSLEQARASRDRTRVRILPD